MNITLKILLLTFVGCFSVAVAGAQTKKPVCDFSELRPVRMSHVLQNAVVDVPKPEYPKAASAVGASGQVIVRVVIDLKGRVVRACVLEGNPLLRKSALDAAKAARFKANFGLSQPQKRYGRRFLEDEITFTFIGKNQVK